MTTTLDKLWKTQIEYNNKIRYQDQQTIEEWTETYLMGIVSEIDEILREINWKRHRKNVKNVDEINLAYEFADLTKYVISLWELWGYEPHDMLQYVKQKSEMLDAWLEQENFTVPDGANVLICDIDGTLGDWRYSFINWLGTKVKEPVDYNPETEESPMMMDVVLSMRYPDYYPLKEEFESTGGYRDIEPYLDMIRIVKKLVQKYGFYLIVVTARPFDHYHRIWHDTWSWLLQYELVPDQLMMESSYRILLAGELQEKANRVIMFDDDPAHIMRAANSGIEVYVKKQPYNGGAYNDLSNVIRITNYKTFPFNLFRPTLRRK